MNADLEELAAIIEQLDQAEFSELRFEKGDFRLHVRRGGHDCGSVEGANASLQAAPSVAPPSPFPAAAAAAAPAASSPAGDDAAPTTPAPATATAPSSTGRALDPDDLPEDHLLVRAPMLGTFYSAPKPGAAPFVQVGDVVGPETTLCIIEVMKLMNSVPAGTSGEIAAVYLSDGDLAEFDQPLFAVKVSA